MLDGVYLQGNCVRVLLLAEACNPEWVSVPLVGWSHAQAIGRVVHTHLVTQVRNRDAIKRAGLVEGRDFTVIDTEVIARRAYQLAGLLGAKGKSWTLMTGLMSLAYPYYEQLVWKQFGKRIRAGEFDIVHRLTPVSPVQPSLLAKRCADAGVPFVLGPLNGGLAWPPGFEAARAREGERISILRDLYRLMPGYYATRRHAAGILIASKNTLSQQPRGYREKCVYIPENAIEPGRFTARRTRTAQIPVRAVFVGRLVPYKGADMLIEAAAPLVRDGKLLLDIVGDGPDMPVLRERVKRLGVENGVTLSGWVDHAKVQDRLIEADLFAFPSIREFGGGAVLEAMAVGLAPMIVDYGGPAELVTPETAFVLPLGTPAELVQQIRQQLQRIVADPKQLDLKGAAALERAHSIYTWDYKARRVVDTYCWLLNRHLPRPAFEPAA